MPRVCLLLVLALALPGCGGCSSGSNVEEIVPIGKPQPVDPPKVSVEDWPWWRGVNRDGKAVGEHEYPLRWSSSENVVWKADVPGHGLSSPIVVGGKVFLTTAEADRKVQSVLCYDRADGNLLWRKDVHQGSLGSKGHGQNSFASPTPACDGERLFCVFLNNKKVYVTALDLAGKQLWQKQAGVHDAQHGYGASPVVYRELLIVAADSPGNGFVAALNRKSGDVYWRRERPSVGSYATPVVAHVAGKDQLLLSGGEKIISYNPMTGEPNWSVDACAETTCATAVWNDDLVFASGGWPKRETVAVRADGSGEIAWRNPYKFYVASMIVVDGKLYGFSDESTGYMFDVADGGKYEKRTRLPTGSWGSPVLAGGRIYAPMRGGSVIVFEPGTFNKLAENRLGDAMDTTPAAAGGRLYLRVVDGGRDVLYCVGAK